MSKGIDYGRGTTNIDKTNGIRFGVIHSGEVLQSWSDSSESEYGEPHCPKCGNVALDSSRVDTDDDTEYKRLHSYGCDDYVCTDCKLLLDSSDVYGEEPIGFTLSDGEYEAQQSGDGTDIFITKSPYYTRAAFCSPCAPGACYLTSPCDDGEKAYCFGHDWFEDGEAPYPVYRVSDDTLVSPE